MENFRLVIKSVEHHSLNCPQTSLDWKTKIWKSQGILHIHLIFGLPCEKEYTYNGTVSYRYLFFTFLAENQNFGTVSTFSRI